MLQKNPKTIIKKNKIQKESKKSTIKIPLIWVIIKDILKICWFSLKCFMKKNGATKRLNGAAAKIVPISKEEKLFSFRIEGIKIT